MWLPMKYTLTRQTSYAALASGRYQNIRLFNYGFARIGDAPASPAPAWTTSRGENLIGRPRFVWHFAQ